MIYYLFRYLSQLFDFPGSQLYQFSSIRAAAAVLLSLVISLLFGKRFIRLLQRKQVGETIRDLGLANEGKKKGTPTMGGLIILAAILIPTILFARLRNVYILLLLLTTVWMGLIGFLDDYIKVFKKDKKGLRGKFKVFGQITLGLIVGFSFYLNKDVRVRSYIKANEYQKISTTQNLRDIQVNQNGDSIYVVDHRSTSTTIPFVKSHQFDYADLLFFLPKSKRAKFAWIPYILLVIFIITAVSNGANLTDGIDGLAAGTAAIIAATLGIFAFLSGNFIFANYLNIMFIPEVGEVLIFAAALTGACAGYLWYNAFPAQIFMGDTGSLAIGGIIATLALMIRKEFLLPILAGVFLAENLSVIIQVAYFKYTKKKYGEGKRIFKMSPLHHHYQKLNYAEPKIVVRFWIIGLMLAILTFITLKIR